MQIVIDIDDAVYNDIKSGKNITNIILNGTILPKNHGRLIDADNLIEFIKDTSKRHKYKDLLLKDSLTVDDVFKAFIETLQNKGLAEGDTPTIIEADKNITYQQVDDYKECNFYKDGKGKDLSEKLDDYYSQPYRDNPFREGRMSGFWGEYEYYCPKCNLEITKVFYDSEHIRVGDCSKCPKCKDGD